MQAGQCIISGSLIQQAMLFVWLRTGALSCCKNSIEDKTDKTATPVNTFHLLNLTLLGVEKECHRYGQELD